MAKDEYIVEHFRVGTVRVAIEGIVKDGVEHLHTSFVHVNRAKFHRLPESELDDLARAIMAAQVTIGLRRGTLCLIKAAAQLQAVGVIDQ